jgi:hypothetical protein
MHCPVAEDTCDGHDEDQRQWDQFRFLEHLVRLAKANAARKLKDRIGA